MHRLKRTIESSGLKRCVLFCSQTRFKDDACKLLPLAYNVLIRSPIHEGTPSMARFTDPEYFRNWNYRKHAGLCISVYLALFAIDMTVGYLIAKKILPKL